MNGEITRDRAIKEISKLLNIGDKKAEAFYYEVRESQQAVLDNFKRMLAMSSEAYKEIREPTSEEKAKTVLLDASLSTFKKAKCIQEILCISYPEALQYMKDSKRSSHKLLAKTTL